MKRSSITMTAVLALVLSCTGCKSTEPQTPSTEALASISENEPAISITSQPEDHYNLPGSTATFSVDESVTTVGPNEVIQTTQSPRTPAKPHITLQPSSETVSLGMKTSFRAYALGEGNLTYQWQYRKNDHTSAWSDFDLAVLSNELTIEAKKEMAGYQVRCAVSDSAGATVYSESATLSILIPITPENFPDDNFREYIHQRAGKDYLSADNQEKWNSIEVSGLGMSSSRNMVTLLVLLPQLGHALIQKFRLLAVSIS